MSKWKNKLKKALCIAGLTSILINLGGSNKKDMTRDNIHDYYNVGYDAVNYLNSSNNQLLDFADNGFYNYTNTSIPFEADNSMIPQGITLYNDYILVSTYDYWNKEKSRIYVLDMNGNVVHVCKLEIIAHVGGIAYDPDHELLWVSNAEGRVNAYRINNILNCEKVYATYRELNLGFDLINYKDEPAVSYLAYNDNHLYVGNYTKSEDGTMKEYNITMNEDETIHLSLNNSYTVPSKVQGVTFYNSGENNYIIFSRSYGTCTTSLLQIYLFKGNEFRSNDANAINYETPSMMEQVIVNGIDLYSLYESNAFPYSLVTNSEDDSIYVTDIVSLTKKINH